MQTGKRDLKTTEFIIHFFLKDYQFVDAYDELSDIFSKAIAHPDLNDDPDERQSKTQFFQRITELVVSFYI